MVAERKPRKAKPRREPVVSVARLTSKNQITIPKAVRDRFNFKAGDDVVFVEDAGGFHIRRRFREDRLKKWQSHFKDLKGQDVDEIIDDWRGR